LGTGVVALGSLINLPEDEDIEKLIEMQLSDLNNRAGSEVEAKPELVPP